MEYTNDSSILHESCLFNNSLSEALNSNNDEILPNLSVCSNDFLEAQISITEQTARIETELNMFTTSNYLQIHKKKFGLKTKECISCI